nr:transposase [Lactobacillus colini]
MRDIVWNKGISYWEMKYQAHSLLDKILYTEFIPKKDKHGKIKVKQIDHHLNPSPNWRSIRNEIVAEKNNSDYLFPAHLIGLTMQDLGQSYKAFFDKKRPEAKKPKYKNLTSLTGSYKDDQASIKQGKLHLTSGANEKEAYGDIRMAEKLPDQKLKTITVIKKDDNYYVAIAQEKTLLHLMKTGQNDAVDVNTREYVSTGYRLTVLPKRLEFLYKRIKHYQRMLAKKRIVNGTKKARQSKNYQIIQEHLRRDHRKVTNIQHDLMQKYTTYLVKYHDAITIEDLNVKKMLMSHVASKGMHRAMAGYFRRTLEYKCQEYGRRLIIADKLFPSTQMCPKCGLIKTGDEKISLSGNKKHKTAHNEFICYGCGYKADRDEKVAPVLMRYSKSMMKSILKQKKTNDRVYAFA